MRAPKLEKRCPRCGLTKPRDAFDIRWPGRLTLQSYCRDCNTKSAVEWARGNRDRHNGNVARWRQQNPERARETARAAAAARRAADPEGTKAAMRSSYLRNRKKKIEGSKAWRERHPEAVRAENKQWREKNPGRNAAKSRAYDARKRNAMPPWADRAAIEAIYVECARINALGGERFEVDHIHPLASPFASGLHVHYNLQIIPAIDNRRKHNRHPAL